MWKHCNMLCAHVKTMQCVVCACGNIVACCMHMLKQCSMCMWKQCSVLWVHVETVYILLKFNIVVLKLIHWLQGRLVTELRRPSEIPMLHTTTLHSPPSTNTPTTPTTPTPPHHHTLHPSHLHTTTPSTLYTSTPPHPPPFTPPHHHTLHPSHLCITKPPNQSSRLLMRKCEASLLHHSSVAETVGF